MKFYYQILVGGLATDYRYYSRTEAEKIAKAANKTRRKKYRKPAKFKAKKIKFITVKEDKTHEDIQNHL